MSPPLPPLPPSGPPNSMNFSRRNATTPSPPSPERRWILASSRNFIARSNVTQQNGGRLAPTPARYAIGSGALLGGSRQRCDGNMHAVIRPALELHLAVDQREDRVVASEAYMVPRLPLGAALADDDVAGHHRFPAELLDAEAAARRVAAVAGGTACLFVCHGPTPEPRRSPAPRRRPRRGPRRHRPLLARAPPGPQPPPRVPPAPGHPARSRRRAAR